MDSQRTQADRPSRKSADPQIGTAVGRYRLVARLGEGGMGVVFRAQDPSLGREVAIKLLHDTSASRAQDLLREAQAMAQLSHPNLVTVHDVGQEGERVFLAMELIDGRSLREWLDDPSRTFRDRLDAVIAAGRGLAAAHSAGIVHRDFKPENVLVDRAGRIKVADFGLARAETVAPTPALVPTADITTTGSVLGTPAYMAPEQHAGEVPGARADQFALAVVMWEAIWSERPFRGADYAVLAFAIRSGEIQPPPKRRDVPAAIEPALRRALATDPEARYPSVDALLSAVTAVLAPPRKRRAWPVIAVALALVLTGGGIAAWQLWPHEPTAPVSAPVPPPPTAEVMQLIDEHKPDLEACSDKVSSDQWRGKVTITFSVNTEGHVDGFHIDRADLQNTDVARCLAATTLAWTFPPGGAWEGNIGFNLKPAQRTR